MQIYTGVYRSVRKGGRINQDSLSMQHIVLSGKECLLAVVCDGIGSLARAEEAGAIAVSGLTDWFYQEGRELFGKRASKESILISLQDQILRIQEFLRYFQKKEQLQTGTTCSALLLIGRRYYIVHIGDSRIYQLKKQRRKGLYVLVPLTRDDHDKSGRLCRALGLAGTDRAVFYTGRFGRKTGFLVSTDGFYKGNDEKMAAQMLGALLDKKRLRQDGQLQSKLNRRLEQLGREAFAGGNPDDKAAVGILIP